MTKTRWFGLAAILVALALLTTRLAAAREDKEKEHDHHAGHFMKCAKACSACQLECASCFDHCVKMVAKGKKEHAITVRTCTDCGQVCAVAATLSASNSPMAVPVCEACAKVCDQCGAACEKFKDDKHMLACAKACRDCAKECREMTKHGRAD
jgi:hypothetical protein